MQPPIAPTALQVALRWSYDGNWGRRYVLMAEDHSVLLTFTFKGFFRQRAEVASPHQQWLIRARGLLRQRYEAFGEGDFPVATLQCRLFMTSRHVGDIVLPTGDTYPVHYQGRWLRSMVIYSPTGNPLFETGTHFNWRRLRLETPVKLFPATREERHTLLFLGMAFMYLQRLRQARNG